MVKCRILPATSCVRFVDLPSGAYYQYDYKPIVWRKVGLNDSHYNELDVTTGRLHPPPGSDAMVCPLEPAAEFVFCPVQPELTT